LALFREALDASARGDISAALPRIADGMAEDYVRFPPEVLAMMDDGSTRSRAADLRRLAGVRDVLEGIVYGDLMTRKDKVLLRYGEKDEEVEHATVHVFAVTIPGFEDKKHGTALFLEAPSGLYWVPFGW